VPDDSLTIRQRAIAAWPAAWQGQNQRDILVTLGYDVDKPWRDLPKKDRDWILFTDEQPVVPVYAGLEPHEVRRALKRKEEPSYQGTFTSARRHVLHTFAHTQSALMKKRVSHYMLSTECSSCHGKRLRRESLSVTFAGLDIADISRLPLAKLAAIMRPYAKGHSTLEKQQPEHPEKAIVAQRIAQDLEARLSVLYDLLNRVGLDGRLEPSSTGEVQLAIEQLGKARPGDVLINDRGFTGYRYLAWHHRLGLDYIARCSTAQFIVGPHRPNESQKVHATKVYLWPLERLAILSRTSAWQGAPGLH